MQKRDVLVTHYCAHVVRIKQHLGIIHSFKNLLMTHSKTIRAFSFLAFLANFLNVQNDNSLKFYHQKVFKRYTWIILWFLSHIVLNVKENLSIYLSLFHHICNNKLYICIWWQQKYWITCAVKRIYKQLYFLVYIQYMQMRLTQLHCYRVGLKP